MFLVDKSGSSVLDWIDSNESKFFLTLIKDSFLFIERSFSKKLNYKNKPKKF